MYLVGEFSGTDMIELTARFKKEVTKEDLAKCKADSWYNVIDVDNKKYYDPEDNLWKDMKVE